jgi:hypothetical protein
MRRLFGRAPIVLARRWLRLERLAMLTLYRDQFAETPGPSVSLALGERTTYRPGAWLLDTFARIDADLGTAYGPWSAPAGFSGLVIDGFRVIPPALGMTVERFEVHAITLPRDQWAAVEIAALDGPGRASVGVVLRASPATPPDGELGGDAYLVTAVRDAGVGRTELARFNAGARTILQTAPTDWRAGDVLRAEVAWNRVRVSRGAIRVLDWIDPTPLLVEGAAGIEAMIATGADEAAIAAWAGGALRQEYLGAVLDMGDVQHTLGQPVTFDLAISNLAPMGGKDRFAALLRHGQNTEGTYDLDRGLVRVYSALPDAEAPLMVAEALIDAPGDLAEERVRVQCRGRDAFLTPRLDPGIVTYLPGGLPSSAPIPADPCARTEPDVIPGAPPDEPDDGGGGAGGGGGPDGVGPEAPPDTTDGAGDGGGMTPLLGGYAIRATYRPGNPAADPPEPPWIAETTVGKLPGPLGDGISPDCVIGPGYGIGGENVLPSILAGAVNAAGFVHVYRPNAPGGQVRAMTLYYRGPDVLGTAIGVPSADLQECIAPGAGSAPGGLLNRIVGYAEIATLGGNYVLGTSISWTFKIARYDASGIHTEADLQALRLSRPDEAGEYLAKLPTRIETLATIEISKVGGGAVNYINEVKDPLDDGPTISLDMFAGPELIGIELIDATIPGQPNEAVVVSLVVANEFGSTGASPSVATP